MSDADTPTDDTAPTDMTNGREHPDRADPDPAAIDTPADEIDARNVWDTDDERVTVYETQTHRNGDTTVVQLSSFGETYQAFVYEVSEQGELLATEEIGAADEGTRIAAQCEYWLQQHPRGILGEPADADDTGGVIDSVRGLFG